MKSRLLHTKIYSDNFFVGLTPIEKFLFIYFITNENVNIIHIYECPDRKIIFDTGVTREQLEKAKEKFQNAGKIHFNNGYILLKNAKKYEEYTGDKNEKAKVNAFNQLDTGIQEWYTSITTNKTNTDTPIDRGMEGVYIPPISHKSEIINHKSKTNGEIRESAEREKRGLDDLTEEDIGQIATDYHVPVSFVMSKIDDIRNYCASKGKRYIDYKATLRNWVKKDAISARKEENGKSKIRIITPDPNWEHSP